MLIFSGTGEVSSPELDPTTISGCTMWISGDQPSLLSLADNDDVPDWHDRVTGTRRMQTAVGFDSPTYQTNEVNGLPIVRFDNTDDRVSYDNGSGSSVPASSLFSAGGFTIFAVIKPGVNGSTNGTELGKNILTAQGFIGLCLFSTGGNNKFSFYRFDGGYLRANSTTTYALGSVYVVECWYDGTNLNIKVNNDATVSTAASNPSSLAVTPSMSSASPMGSDMLELITYNVSVGSVDRTTLREGLADKWGVTLAP